MRIVQLSDMHFGAHDDNVVRAVNEFFSQHSVDIIIASGDITQRARKHQFMQARSFLTSLPATVKLTIPGNHDLPVFNWLLRLVVPYRNYIDAFNNYTQFSWYDNGVLIICLDSTRLFHYKNGSIDEDERDLTTKVLEQHPDAKLKIVVAHHPFCVPTESELENQVANAEDALTLWSNAGLDMVMGGHIHLPFVKPVQSAFPKIQSNAWIIQAGTATSTRTRNNIPNSFCSVVFEKDKLSTTVERWDYINSSFSLVDEKKLWD